MKTKLFILFAFFAGCSQNQLFETQVQDCVYKLLNNTSQIRHIDGSFNDVTDFCKDVYHINKTVRQEEFKPNP